LPTLPPGKARDRINPMRLFVNTEEREIIKAKAEGAGMTASAFLRAAAMGAVPRSAPDLRAVDTLAKVNADLARLGNLLKLYLQDSKPDHVAAVRLLEEIGELRSAARAAVRKITT
jgi:hypothetical protein